MGAQGEPPPAEPFLEVVDVRVVNVDVFVSDKKGRPIEGLAPGDFELVEDGRPVEITYFRAGQRPRFEDGATPESPQTQGGRDKASEAVEPIWAVLFLDNLNLDPSDRQRIADDLARFVGSRRPEHLRILLATYDVGLRIQTDFTTTDAEELRRALDTSVAKSSFGRQDAIEYARLFRDVQELYEVYNLPKTGGFNPCPSVCECAWEQMVALWEQYAISSSDRLFRSGEGLGELVSALGGLPGRKTVFYVSSGLQQRPGIGALNYLTDICPEKAYDAQPLLTRFDETPFLNRIAARANANRVTIYSLDAGGLRADRGSSVEFAFQHTRPSNLTSLVRRANLQSSLYYLANETGGEAVFNENRPLDRLNRIARNFSSHYSLGFSPSRDADDRAHSLRVRLPGHPKARLRYRRLYRDRPRSEALGDRLMASLRLGFQDNDLGVTARVAEGGSAGTSVDEPSAATPNSVPNDKRAVPIRVTVPIGSLVTVGEDPARALLRVLIAAEDEKGRRTEIREKLIEVAIEDESSTRHDFVVMTHLGPARHQVAVGVIDELGRAASYSRIEVAGEPAVPSDT